ncbi:hypothetical protein [Bacillus licheniformis]|uniref:hypothetical protein n=1 Tax=Bacillus licheniformis TaxID=1402 RepID=UPI00092B40FE|nr:hypothetical protein [Bacillus licheniformis]OJT57361.1 hypothetical protein BFP47_11675 [Bacillus licheniformis]OJT69997.1 hypothetical protein BFP46_05215 [Bacillus licheniformis]
MNCTRCNKYLGFYYKNASVIDVDCERVKGLYCEECKDTVENELKQQRFVEEYKGSQIYFKDGGYYPYWGCVYHFRSLEGARDRVDNPNTAILATNISKTIIKNQNYIKIETVNEY